MKFGISNNVKSRVVRECTPELFHQAMRSELVAEVCAEIADGLERLRRGELTKEEYDTLKAGLKKRLPIFTPHATFRNGRRLNADAIPSGLSMYDVDHINDPRGYWEQKRQELETRGVMRYVVLAHITPSTEGLRLFFIIPAGMDLAEAQRWMSQQMGDGNYDVSVKDYARSSFVVPEGYVLYLDEERLFNGELKIENGELPASTNPPVGTHHGASDDNAHAAETPQASDDAPADTPHTDAPWCVPTFKGMPYSQIIQQWFKLAGGEPVQGERNDKLHRLASHLRYIVDNDEALLLQVMPRYGLSEEEMKGLIHSACSARWYAMPKMMRQAIENEERRMKNEESLKNEERRMKNEEWPADDEENNSQLSILNSPLPKRLPALIKLLVSRTPDVYKPAVAHAVFPALGAHLHKVRFRGARSHADECPHGRHRCGQGLYFGTHQPHHGRHPPTRRGQPATRTRVEERSHLEGRQQGQATTPRGPYHPRD